MKLIAKRIIGTTMALGTLVFMGTPTFAATSDSDTDNQTNSMELIHSEHHQQHDGAQSHGMMGAGSEHKAMMGSGSGHMAMMGASHGSGMMSFSASSCVDEKDLSIDDVRNILEGQLAWAGNKRLKVGDVKQKDEDTYVADIVTVDNSLVERIEIDRKTGRSQRVE